MKLLMHTCCAPCSVYCIESLRNEGIEPTCYWYNPNIHPYIEYKTRRDTLVEYSKIANFKLIINEEYGLRKFCKNVINDLDNRCVNYCYKLRLEATAKYAKENGFDGFTSTLFVSPYQKHEELKRVCEELALKYGIKFIYRDFRVGFLEGQNKARQLGLYMQKYCGCIFSEEDRYLNNIIKDSEKESLIKLLKPSTMFKKQIMEYKRIFLENNDSFDGCAGLENCNTYEEWINFEGRLLEKYGDNYVPSTVYLAIRKEDNKLIGMIDFRYELTDFLLNYGGNIGYSVLPEERQKGYAKEMLRLVLLKCKEYGKNKVLLTCDKENIASSKTIIANGGILENEVKDVPKLGKSGIIQRYWIRID